MKKTVKFIFQDKPELMLECEESKLALNVEKWKRTLKLTYNAKYDIVPNDYTISSVVDDSPSSSDTDQSATVSKNTKSTKSRKKANDVLSVFELLDIDGAELTGMENGTGTYTADKSDDGIPS